MICEFVAFCIVGGVQISPWKYRLEVLDTDTGVIESYILPVPESLQIPAEMLEV